MLSCYHNVIMLLSIVAANDLARKPHKLYVHVHNMTLTADTHTTKESRGGLRGGTCSYCSEHEFCEGISVSVIKFHAEHVQAYCIHVISVFIPHQDSITQFLR